MLTGLLAGFSWAIETVIMGIALVSTPFVSTAQAVFLAPFISTFLHDSFSTVWICLFNGIRGRLPEVWHVLTGTKDGKFIILGAILGGPIGMTGYMLCVTHLEASIGSIASAIYPAVGAALATVLLKEKMPWYRWFFLLCTLGGIAVLSYTPGLAADNFVLGIAGALIYAFGMSIENVILAKCLKNPDVPFECALNIRQLSSGITTGLILLPFIGGWEFTGNLISTNPENVLLIIALAAFFGTISYIFYAVSLIKIGVAKSLALNGIYPAWAMLINAFFISGTESLSLVSIISAAVVLVFGILTAVDFRELTGKSQLKQSDLNNCTGG